MANILSIAQTALNAAQVGLATTGHNIANASTPGYSRQVVLQAALSGQDMGGGFIGKGTAIAGVQRIYSAYLGQQVVAAQTSSGQLDSYYTQINRINNLVADSSAGLTPALQDFFKGVQDLAANTSNTSGAPARQAVLSAAESLSARLQSLDGQLRSIGEGINGEIRTTVGTINSYADQLARLNDSIAKAKNTGGGNPPNDLLDQRDYLVSQLSKETKVSVVDQDGSYSVFIGNGQPLVVGTMSYKLAAVASPTDLNRIQVGYVSNGTTVVLAESGLPGGKLGGLFEFRSQTLDTAKNALGRIAIGLAETFNAQHRLGQDQTGQMGGNFFTIASPLINANSSNTGSSVIGASITDAGALTTSDYRLAYDGTNYTVTRLSDNKSMYSNAVFPATEIDGVTFSEKSGTMNAGDNFVIKPTVNGAAEFSVAVKDLSKIAAAVPIRTSAPTSNAGSGAISAGSVDDTFTLGTVSPSVTLSYTTAAFAEPSIPLNSANTGDAVLDATVGDRAALTGSDYRIDYDGANYTVTRLSDNASVYTDTTFPSTTIDGIDFSISSGAMATGDSFTVNAPRDSLNGFPSTMPVTVTANGTTTTYSAGTPVPYTAGATVTFGGASFTLSGEPANGDTFTVGQNLNGTGDNRNMLLLGALQSSNTLADGTTNYNGAYSQLVSLIGNKTHELQVTQAAEKQLLNQALQAQQSESGVNLDEEATNLLRYQQAYQAAGKVMQTVSDMFDVLISLGR
jgi:flagellar hook-associated protein 1 FlgK